MALTRDEKNQQIEQMTKSFEDMKAIVFTEYRGMTMKDMQTLRKKLKAAGIDYHVIKGTLMRIALDKAGLEVPAEILDKPLAAAFSAEDEVAPAKVITAEGKDVEALKVVGGLINKEYFDNGAIKRLATLPSREELYAKVVGSVASPLTQMVGVMQGNIRGLVAVLKQHQAKVS